MPGTYDARARRTRGQATTDDEEHAGFRFREAVMRQDKEEAVVVDMSQNKAVHVLS